MRLSVNWLYSLILVPLVAVAGEADVVGVAVKHRGNGLLQFDVTISHQDEGWEHYVDKWEVLDTDGNVIASRTLFHPHAGEKTFTRSLVGVKIPPGVREVVVRAHDSVHEYGGKTMTVAIP